MFDGYWPDYLGKPPIETYAASPVRVWTLIDGIAFPTDRFHHLRTVWFSDEGNENFPRWVVLDRFNDPSWVQSSYTRSDLTRLWRRYDEVISSEEGFGLYLEPRVVLAPPEPGASLMTRVVYHLARLVD